ncbi:SMC family ATPase [Vibrio profundum]|uniref:SbcC/MukB-like Walker B domain-containing protein n=1 Tax=Vibrio profundum TaxID=2910247 RepID=UPI003D139161
MRPLKLIMQAFGPFAQTEQIDFTLLGRHPLFLINGPTGSGKTSILDAMCFALFGETTGNERQGMQMRCDLAPITTPTEVCLEFALHDKVYRVTRSPEQEAPKSRGEGTTTRKHMASLYEITGEEVLLTSKTAQVKVEVSALIGLNDTQFRQVMVLPQGKFRELLLASSKEREEIFGQLFQTDIYKKIEGALKDKASAISKAKGEFDNQIEGALKVAGVMDEQELLHKRENLSGELTVVTEQEKGALQVLTQGKSELEKAKRLESELAQRQGARQALAEHIKRQPEIDEWQKKQVIAHVAAKLELPYSDWKNSIKRSDELYKLVSIGQSALDAANAEQELSTKAMQNAQEQAKPVPELNEQAIKLEGIREQLNQKGELQNKLAAEKTRHQKCEIELGRYIDKKNELKQAFDMKVVELERAQTQCMEKGKVETEVSDLTRLVSDLNKLAGFAQEVQRLEQFSPQYQQTADKAQQVLKRKQEHANQLELSWHSGQAALLAQTLQQGVSCPVCGSCEHPSPAQVSAEQVTKAQVQAAREQESQALEVVNLQSNQLEIHRATLKQASQRYHDFILELGDSAVRDRSQVSQQLTDAKMLLNKLNLIDLAKMKQELDALSQRCEKGEVKILEKTNEIAASTATVDSLQEQLDVMGRTIDAKFASVDVVEREITKLKEVANKLSRDLDAAKAKTHQADVSLSKADAELKAYQQQYTDESHQQTQLHQVWQGALSKTEFTSEVDYLESKSSEQDIQQRQQVIEDYQHIKVKLSQTVEDLQTKLNGVVAPDTINLMSLLEQAQQAYDKIRTEFNEIQANYKNLDEVRTQIEQLHQENIKLEQEYKVYGTLYDVASGKTGSRVSLHRFVLGVLLDDVLIQASQRLNMMSKGRYRLTRKTDGFKGSAGRGLDLEVEDGYTGKTRDVATLSGGESFMAALALALGLSDVVQSYSGGIRLETLFIDEGFGSLDPESLDLAIQTLVDLQQTGRMIGVISHVSELKEQLTQRIDVVASRLGSTVKVHSYIQTTSMP